MWERDRISSLQMQPDPPAHPHTLLTMCMEVTWEVKVEHLYIKYSYLLRLWGVYLSGRFLCVDHVIHIWDSFLFMNCFSFDFTDWYRTAHPAQSNSSSQVSQVTTETVSSLSALDFNQMFALTFLKDTIYTLEMTDFPFLSSPCICPAWVTLPPKDTGCSCRFSHISWAPTFKWFNIFYFQYGEILTCVRAVCQSWAETPHRPVSELLCVSTTFWSEAVMTHNATQAHEPLHIRWGI